MLAVSASIGRSSRSFAIVGFGGLAIVHIRRLEGIDAVDHDLVPELVMDPHGDLFGDRRAQTMSGEIEMHARALLLEELLQRRPDLVGRLLEARVHLTRSRLARSRLETSTPPSARRTVLC